MIELANEIGLDKALIDKLEKTDITDITLDNLDNYNDLTRLAVCLNYAKNITQKEYEKLAIPREIFIDTMHDIAIWCENNGNKGLKNHKWICNHLQLELFKIGRLQYQMYKCENDTLDYVCLPFDYGDNLVYIHIPQGEKLRYEACLQSLSQAKQFFEEYFPKFEYTYFFCESWLLYRENQLFMSPDSNILQFQLLFDIVYSAPDDKQAIERIFGKKHILPLLYPEKSSLQKQARRFITKGGKLGIGIGLIHKSDIL